MLFRLTKGAKSRFAAPLSMFKALRRSRVPEGGWTHEEFLRQERKLTADTIAARTAAVLKASRMMARPLSALLKSHVERVVKRFADTLPPQYRETSAPVPGVKAVTRIPVSEHQSLWADALAYVLGNDAEVEIVNTVRPAMQSLADDMHARSHALLGTTVERGPSAVLAADVEGMASQVRRINETTRSRLAAVIRQGIDDGAHPYEVMASVRDRIPQIATNRVPTIVRTEMGRVADKATIRAMKDSSVVTHVSVTGCQAIEPGIPTFRGVPTCNIKNVPIAYAGTLQFHINHTGAIIASGFKTQRGQDPDMPLRGGSGSGTWEDNGRPVPAIVQEPPPGPPVAQPPPPAPPVTPPAPQPTPPTAPSATPAARPPRPRPPRAPAPKPEPAIPNAPAPPPVPTAQETAQALDDITSGHITRRSPRFLGGRWTPPANAADYVTTASQSGLTVFESELAQFGEDFGMSPDAVRDLMLRDTNLSSNGYSNVRTLIKRNSKGWTYETTAEHESDSEFRLTRHIQYRDGGGLGKAKHEHLQLPNSAQGAGLGKTLLRNQLELYDHLGVDRIELYANVDVGGYAWARYGFKPMSPEWWKALKPQLSENLSQIEAVISPAAKAEIKRLLKSTDPAAIRQLAAMREPSITPSGRSLTVGKRMLLGTDWFGALDLTNETEYAIFSSYIN